jgi:NitT/TauT family transport system ATP-binding protein
VTAASTAAAQPPAVAIQLKHVTKQFVGRGDDEPVTVLDRVSLDIRDREFLMVLGPSGCGKTTMLRVIAGLLKIDGGELLIDGRATDGPGPDRAMVFQGFALLPWRTVLDNVAFGLELRGVAKSERSVVARHYLEMVGLAGQENRLPKELSGGMQQRVGLARALAVDPRILLLDEPFGALDEQTRRLLQEELLTIWERERKTAIFITHSIDEALFLGDRIVVMAAKPGRIDRIIDNPLPRPRDRAAESSKEYTELKQSLWEDLRAMITDAQAL